MRLSSFKMPRWWQHCWRARYPMGVRGSAMVTVLPDDPQTLPGTYHIKPMGCGCGYTIRKLGSHPKNTPGHWPSLGGAIRAARKHANEEPVRREKQRSEGWRGGGIMSRRGGCK